MLQRNDSHELKLEQLREALARGEADLAAGRFVVLADDEELCAFFAELQSGQKD